MTVLSLQVCASADQRFATLGHANVATTSGYLHAHPGSYAHADPAKAAAGT